VLHFLDLANHQWDCEIVELPRLFAILNWIGSWGHSSVDQQGLHYPLPDFDYVDQILADHNEFQFVE